MMNMWRVVARYKGICVDVGGDGGVGIKIGFAFKVVDGLQCCFIKLTKLHQDVVCFLFQG